MSTEKNKDPQSIVQCLGSNKLRNLIEQANQVSNLNQTVQQLLPDVLQGQVRALNYQGNTLTLSTANASIATQLRFQQDVIMDKLKQLNPFRELKTISIKVRP